MDKVTLKIDGMRCSMCEANVADAIRRALPEAKKVKASHGKGIATFVLPEGVNPSPAIERISSGGYRVLNTKKEPAKSGFFLWSK